MADNASRDENNIPTLLGVSSADGITPVRIYADPTTHRLLTSFSGGSGITGTIAATEVAFGTGTDVIGGDPLFEYDAVNHNLRIGPTSTGISTENRLAIIGNANDYHGTFVQNMNGGTSASNDMVVGNDLTTADMTTYMDIGLNSSGNTNPLQTLFGASDVYLFTSGQVNNVNIGTGVAGKVIKFFTGGTLTTNERIRVTDTALVPGPNAYAIGSTTQMFSNLYLATGATLNWNNGTLIATQSGGNFNLTGSSGASLGIAAVSNTAGAIGITGVTTGTAITANTVTTGDVLTATGMTTGTAISIGGSSTASGNGLLFNTTAAAATTVSAISVTGTATMTADYTGAFVKVTPTRTMTAAATRTHSGNMMQVNPTYSITGTSASIMNVTGDTATIERTISNASSSGSSSMNVSGALFSIINTKGTATNPVVDTGILLNIAQNNATASGTVLQVNNTGTGLILDAQGSGTSMMNVAVNGSLHVNNTIAGSTGAQTINKSAGQVQFAAAASSLVVTNSLVTANSMVIATVATNDSTLLSVQAVAASGSFTLFGNAAATGTCKVNFLVIN